MRRKVGEIEMRGILSRGFMIQVFSDVKIRQGG